MNLTLSSEICNQGVIFVPVAYREPCITTPRDFEKYMIEPA